MLLLPVLVLVWLAIENALVKRTELEQIEQVVERVELAALLDAVAHNVAVERGLTAGFLASGGSNNQEKLGPQRQIVDVRLDALKVALQQLDIERFGEEVVEQLNQLDRLLAERTDMRAVVDRLEREPSAFEYYSMVNGVVLGLIERMAIDVTDPVASRQLNTLLPLLWMKERAGQERGALNGVFTSGVVDSRKRDAINRYINEQSLRLNQFLGSATKANRALYHQRLSSAVVDPVLQRRQFFQAREQKLELLGQLKAQIGYGGMIHNFKNFVLRGSDKYRKRAEAGYQQALDTLAQFRALEGVHQSELVWLRQIEEVIEQYYQGVAKVAALFASERDSHTIDKAVKVDDAPALEALQRLDRFLEVDAAEWFKVSTARIGQINQVPGSAYRKE